MVNLFGKRVLLIGGAGFVGHHLALKLHQCGAKPLIIDLLLGTKATPGDVARPMEIFYERLLEKRLALLAEAGIPVFRSDARKSATLERFFTDLRPQVVIHLAGIANTQVFKKRIAESINHSTQTLMNVLAACSRFPPEHFLYFSSSLVYGEAPEGSSEEKPCRPNCTYGSFKLLGEDLTQTICSTVGIPFTIIRPSALYGEGCIGRRVVQVFLENCFLGKDLILHGSGNRRLNFTYVGDLVQGVMACMSRSVARNHIFNITHPRARSLSELVDLVAGLFPSVRVRPAANPRAAYRKGVVCSAKAHNLLGFRPTMGLEEGLERYCRWYRQLPEFQHVLAPAGV